MTVQRDRLHKRLSELERKTGTALGRPYVLCPVGLTDEEYGVWHREHVAPLEREGRGVNVVRFVRPART